MQKQKKQKKDKFKSPVKSKTISRSSIQWGQQDFTQLYPQAPAIMTSATFFVISLNYKGEMIKVKLPTGI